MMMLKPGVVVGSILLSALLLGCAGTPRPLTKPGSPCGLCAARAGSVGAVARADAAAVRLADAALLDLVPPGVLAAVVVRQSLVSTLLGGALTPALRQDLSALFRARLGADLMALTGVVGFLVALDEKPQAALLVRLPVTAGAAAPRAVVVERRRGIAITAAGSELVSARVPQGVLLGELAAVRVGLDHLAAVLPTPATGRRGGLAARLRQVDGPGVELVAGLAAAGASVLAPQAAGLGVEAMALGYGPERQLVLRLSAAPARLDGVLALFAMGRQLGLGALEQLAQQKRDSASLVEAAGAIASYHQLRDLLQAIQPQKHGDGLVVQVRLPAWASGNATTMLLGVGAAIAIPQFAKYQQRARVQQGRMVLKRLQDALLAYHAGMLGHAGRLDHAGRAHRGKAFRWPATTPWSPAKGCCTVPGQAQSCAVSSATFAHPSWRALGFAPTEPTPYQFRLTSGGRGPRAWVEIEAQADLGCDGTLTSQRQRGWLAPDGTVTFGSAGGRAGAR